jgi:WXG100 family type VII secretion target
VGIVAEFKVNTSRLRESADVISASTREFRDIMEDIKGVMETVRNIWASEAADMFFAQFNRLDANFQAYEKVIGEYAVHLNNAATEYAAVDNRTGTDTQVLDGSVLYT